jgi:hypothetical protein
MEWNHKSLRSICRLPCCRWHLGDEAGFVRECSGIHWFRAPFIPIVGCCCVALPTRIILCLSSYGLEGYLMVVAICAWVSRPSSAVAVPSFQPVVLRDSRLSRGRCLFADLRRGWIQSTLVRGQAGKGTGSSPDEFAFEVGIQPVFFFSPRYCAFNQRSARYAYHLEQTNYTVELWEEEVRNRPGIRFGEGPPLHMLLVDHFPACRF